MFACFMAVMAMGIVYEIDASTIVGCVATFFCVAKSNGLLRIIFDCRPLNRCCATPIPVGLATMSEILEKASVLGVNGIISGDFRANFFELKLPGSVGLLFGFLFRGRKFLSRLFAMGFSWSPAVSQGGPGPSRREVRSASLSRMCTRSAASAQFPSAASRPARSSPGTS